MQLATDYSHFYPIDTVDYLMNPSVLQTQAQWICAAFYPTAAPPTPPPTRLPLITTIGTTTNPAVRTTVNPLFPPIASCKQNVLFLIDQSQTLLLSGYNVRNKNCIKVQGELCSMDCLYINLIRCIEIRKTTYRAPSNLPKTLLPHYQHTTLRQLLRLLFTTKLLSQNR